MLTRKVVRQGVVDLVDFLSYCFVEILEYYLLLR